MLQCTTARAQWGHFVVEVCGEEGREEELGVKGRTEAAVWL